MSATSQNGYAANDRTLIRSATIPGTDVTVSVRTGPAGDLLLAAAARWHREVEPLRAPDGILDCWGYAERNIRGSSWARSNHASGTALDLRARSHPLGTAPAVTFTAAQVAAVRAIVAAFAPCLRWGGDYTGRQDPMHLEIVAAEQVCAAVLTPQSVEMDMTQDEHNMLALLVSQLCPPGFHAFPGGSNETLSAVDYLRRANQRDEAILAALTAIQRKLGA